MIYHVGVSGKDEAGVFRWPELKGVLVAAPEDSSTWIRGHAPWGREQGWPGLREHALSADRLSDRGASYSL